MFRRYGLAFVAATTTITGSMTDAAAADPPPAPSSLPGFPEPRPRLVPVAALSAKIANVAHRGASAYAPENTLAAFRLARSKHADVFEIDVQETKDHKLVVVHDSTLTRTTNLESVYPARSTSKVSGFTLAQIKKLDAGSWFAAKYKGERVPTLSEVLTAMDGRGLGLLVEIKNPASYPGIERRIAAELKRHPSWLRPDPRQRRLAVQSFDWNSVKRFHSALPAVPTALLGKPEVADLPKVAKYADQINPTYGSLTASYVKKVHATRMRVQTWTLDDRTRMRKAVGLGVDGIITNRPDVLYGVLSAAKAKDA
ncbi:glycerophosphodiester phosphodiesterase [Actinomadura macra]|uniref:glycerophosphodiester phosphodiesterase n=1 Tax=Actinomadura macra TaxID=46164 RepID=UPI000AAAC223|nr:glycerophosphodiester phosphodiesterase family protein [Actinomadura macra]